MSEEQSQPQSVPQSTVHADWFLQQLVEMVNGSTIELGITLTVGGVLVTGTLISGKRYFKEFGEAFASGVFKEEPGGEEKKRLAAVFSQKGAIYNETERQELLPPPAFIHLRHARFFDPSGQAIPSAPGALWRGRLDAVSGFFLGSLEAGRP